MSTITSVFSMPSAASVTQRADIWVAWIKALREESEMRFSKWAIYGGKNRTDSRLTIAGPTGVLMKRVDFSGIKEIHLPNLSDDSSLTMYDTTLMLGLGRDRSKIGRLISTAYPYGSITSMRILDNSGFRTMERMVSFLDCADFLEKLFRMALFTEQDEAREAAWIYREL